MRNFAPWDAAMNGNPANPVLTAHLTAGSYTLKIRASSGKNLRERPSGRPTL